MSQVLGLADIGVTDHDKVQLQGLVHAVSTGPKQLEQLDFDANYIGRLHCMLMDSRWYVYIVCRATSF